MYYPTAKTYFSGCGGTDCGMMLAGVDVVQSLEMDATCCNTLRMNFSHQVVERDITTVTVLDQPRTDIMVGTYPCTKYSAIADIHGTRTGDDLYLHFFRHVAIARPEMWLVENVPGMRKFQVVMEALTKLPDYYVRVECPVDASQWLPQRRPRLIVIGTRKPFIPSSSLAPRSLRLADLLEEDPQIDVPAYVYKRLEGGYRDLPIITNPADPEARAPLCVAHYAKDVSTRLVADRRFRGGARPYTPREYARLQGFPDSFRFAGSGRDIYRQVGNAVAVPVGEQMGAWAVEYFNRKVAA